MGARWFSQEPSVRTTPVMKDINPTLNLRLLLFGEAVRRR